MAASRKSQRETPPIPSGRPASPPNDWSLAACIALLVIVPLAVFGRSIGFDFVGWDDNLHLWENPYFQPFNAKQLARLWLEPYFGEYVPVLYTWFGICVWISGWVDGTRSYTSFNPAVFHAGNVLLHVGCVLLVFRLLRRLLGQNRAACWGALLFAVHPLVTEPVVWVSEARGLLATFLGLLAIWHYFEAVDPGIALPGQSKSLPVRRRQLAHYLFGTLCLGLALASKPSAVSWVLVVAALDFGYLQRDWRAMAKSLAPWVAMTLILTVVTKFEQSSEVIHELVPLWQRPLIAADALAFYLYKLVLPQGLSPDHGRMPSVAIAHGWIYWTWIVPVAMVVLLWRLGSRVAWTAAAVFFAGLAPVLGFLPFVFQDISTVADRYLYISMLGVALFGGWLVTRLPAKSANIGFGLVVVLWSGLAWQQASHWRDSETLFRYTLEVNPASRPILDNLVGVLHRSHDYEQALELAQRSLQHWPQHPKPHVNMGLVLLSLNRPEEAVAILQKGVEAHPDSLPMRRALATGLTKLGRLDDAHRQYEAMLQIDANSAVAALGLASLAVNQQDRSTAERIYRQLSEVPPADAEMRIGLADLAAICGDPAAAREHYQTALEGNVDRSVVWYKIGQLEFASQNWQPALDAFQESVRLGSQDPQVHRYLAMIYTALRRPRQSDGQYRALLAVEPNDRMALNNLAWSLATSHTATAADGDEAVRLAEHLCQLGGAQAGEFDTLAAAYAQAGRFDDATRGAQYAIELATAAGDAQLADEIRTRLRYYERHQAYRELAAASTE